MSGDSSETDPKVLKLQRKVDKFREHYKQLNDLLAQAKTRLDEQDVELQSKAAEAEELTLQKAELEERLRTTKEELGRKLKDRKPGLEYRLKAEKVEFAVKKLKEEKVELEQKVQLLSSQVKTVRSEKGLLEKQLQLDAKVKEELAKLRVRLNKKEAKGPDNTVQNQLREEIKQLQEQLKVSESKVASFEIQIPSPTAPPSKRLKFMIHEELWKLKQDILSVDQSHSSHASLALTCARTISDFGANFDQLITALASELCQCAFLFCSKNERLVICSVVIALCKPAKVGSSPLLSVCKALIQTGVSNLGLALGSVPLAFTILKRWGEREVLSYVCTFWTLAAKLLKSPGSHREYIHCWGVVASSFEAWDMLSLSKLFPYYGKTLEFILARELLPNRSHSLDAQILEEVCPSLLAEGDLAKGLTDSTPIAIAQEVLLTAVDYEVAGDPAKPEYIAIDHEDNEAGQAIRLLTRTMDWAWTNDVFLRECLWPLFAGQKTQVQAMLVRVIAISIISCCPKSTENVRILVAKVTSIIQEQSTSLIAQSAAALTTVEICDWLKSHHDVDDNLLDPARAWYKTIVAQGKMNTYIRQVQERDLSKPQHQKLIS